MRPSAVLSSLLLLAATTSAWPNMLSNPVDALRREIAPLLVARQDDSSSSASSQRSSEVKESTTSQTGDSEKGSSTSDSTSATASGDNEQDEETTSSGTAKETGTSKNSGSGTASKTGSSSTKSGSKTSGTTTGTPQYDPRNPAGGASMITPNALSSTSYYKIKDQITFAWNYTSLSQNPARVEVLATCSANNALYTIAANETWHQTQTIIWDTGKYQSTGTIPLLTETYTLIVHDAAKDISATASPGYFGTWKQYSFGMYEPQPYTPIADYVCATCSSAMSLMEKQTYAFLLSMAGVTVLTFGWFTGVAGLW